MTDARAALSTTVTRHKVIDSWHFTAAALQAADPKRGVRHKVEVALVAPSASASIQFEAKCADLGVTLTDTDLQRLHDRMLEALTEVVELRDGATWEPWLEVCVGAGSLLRSEPTTTRELKVSYRVIQRGTHPNHPGAAFTLNTNGHVAAFPKPLLPDDLVAQNKALFEGKATHSAEALSQLLNQHDRRTANMTYAYLPDTPVNRDALDRILSAMDELTERLHTLMHPEQVAANLAQLTLGPLLGHAT